MAKRDRVETNGIDHVHLNVDRLDEAIALFTRLFDCKHNRPLYIESIDGINSMNSFGLDVIAPASEEGLYAKMMRRMGGEGISAVSFYVDDLDDATRKIEATGIRKISEIGYPGIERQTQFHAGDCYGMSLELVYLYPDALEKMRALQAEQGREHGGEAYIEAQPGAVATGGVHHVRLRVPSPEDLTAAIEKFESWFECSWERAADGRSATSTLDVHLLVSDDGRQGVDAFGMAVPDLEAATRRAEAVGMTPIEAPSYLRERERVACYAPSDCFGLSLVLVESDRKRPHRHH